MDRVALEGRLATVNQLQLESAQFIQDYPHF